MLFGMLRLAQLYRIALTDEFYEKMKENERKYPVEKARWSSLKYDEFRSRGLRREAHARDR